MDIPLPAVRPGDPVTARLIVELYAAARRLRILPTDGTGLEVAETDAGIALGLAGAPGIWIKLTSNSGASYAWTRQLEAASGGWTAGTQSGTAAADPAIEVNGNAAVAANTVVRAWRTGLGDLRFLASGC